jgi:hypothetical protein
MEQWNAADTEQLLEEKILQPPCTEMRLLQLVSPSPICLVQDLTTIGCCLHNDMD